MHVLSHPPSGTPALVWSFIISTAAHFAVGASKTAGSILLFMLPGMAHCGNGEGPNRFETMDALTQWVEKGQVPKQMIASHFTNAVVDRTRPVCPYPQIAAYKGTGSMDDAANFVCKAP